MSDKQPVSEVVSDLPPSDPKSVIDTRINVRQFGYVQLLDVMGSDRAILDAARTSFCGHKKPTTKAQSDATLLRYLMRHRHSTPFEMCEIKIGISAPMSVMRQWVRHRTACLHGRSVVYSGIPGDETYEPRTLESLYMLKNDPEFTGDIQVQCIPEEQLGDETPDIVMTEIDDIIMSGVKKLFKLTTEGGHELLCSEDHSIWTMRGWQKLSDIAVGDVLCAVAEADPDDNYAYYVKVAAIEPAGEELTYDVIIRGKDKNLIANGLLVHNSANEFSTRYAEVPDYFSVVNPHEWRMQAKSNKQGSDGLLTDAGEVTVNGNTMVASHFAEQLTQKTIELQQKAYDLYKQALEAGVSREQARDGLPLSTYTVLVWKCNLHNLFHFLGLRMDSHAQQEIREFANAVAEIVKRCFPAAYAAFEDYRLNAMTLSRPEQEALQTRDITLLKGREQAELIAKLPKLGITLWEMTKTPSYAKPEAPPATE